MRSARGRVGKRRFKIGGLELSACRCASPWQVVVELHHAGGRFVPKSPGKRRNSSASSFHRDAHFFISWFFPDCGLWFHQHSICRRMQSLLQMQHIALARRTARAANAGVTSPCRRQHPQQAASFSTTSAALGVRATEGIHFGVVNDMNAVESASERARRAADGTSEMVDRRPPVRGFENVLAFDLRAGAAEGRALRSTVSKPAWGSNSPADAEPPASADRRDNGRVRRLAEGSTEWCRCEGARRVLPIGQEFH